MQFPPDASLTHMKPIAARLKKIARMPPAEWRERGRQLLLKSGERFLRMHQGELSDRAFRQRLLPPFSDAAVDTVASAPRTRLPAHEMHTRRPVA